MSPISYISNSCYIEKLNKEISADVQWKRVELAYSYIRLNFDPEWKKKYTPLTLTIFELKNWDLCKELIEMEAEIDLRDPQGNLPIQIAIETCNEEIAQLLIDSGANIQVFDSDGLSLLHLAAEGGMLKICELLVKKGIDVNSVGIPMHYSKISEWTESYSDEKKL